MELDAQRKKTCEALDTQKILFGPFMGFVDKNNGEYHLV